MTQNTILYSEEAKQLRSAEIMKVIYQALNEKGYNPVNQIVGYIISGDPTYITSHMGARSLITKLERDELLEGIIRTYLDTICPEEKK